MTDLLVATYLWKPDAEPGKFHEFGVDDVHRLRDAVQRHLRLPHEFAVITDNPEAFVGEDILAIPLDRTTHVQGRCYCRLMTFHPNGPEMFGAKRMLQLDLDVVVVGDITPLVERPEDLVLWHNPLRVPTWEQPENGKFPFYNTSFVLHTLGTRPDLWRRFEQDHGMHRDDQWYLSGILGPCMPYWDGKDGLYRTARGGDPRTGVMGELPDNARIITFPGSQGKPWQPEMRAANPWIAEHYRMEAA